MYEFHFCLFEISVSYIELISQQARHELISVSVENTENSNTKSYNNLIYAN